MALRSGILLLTIGVIAVALPLAAVLLWDRVRGPRPARVAGRLGLLVAAQVTAVLFIAAAINDYGYFFDSWSQLFGASATRAPTVAASHVAAPRRHDVRLVIRHFGAPDPPLAASLFAPTSPVGRRSLPVGVGPLTFLDWSVRSQWPKVGAVARVDFAGRASGVRATGYVYLPPSYFYRGAGRARLPVVEVIADNEETSYDLVYRTPMPGYLLRVLREHRSLPYVLVLLDTGRDPFACTDGASRLTFFAQDVPRIVSRVLRVRPTQYAAVGFGMGGYCATRLGLLAPGRFARAVSILGCYAPVVGPDLSSDPAGPASRRRSDDLVSLIRDARPPAHFLVAPGLARSGPCGIAAADRFVHAVRTPSSADQVTGYAHEKFRFLIWKALLPRVFEWLGPHAPAVGGGR